jgi:hypothetical protein
MPAIAENLCQRCGAQTEAVMLRGRASVEPCPCGGMRQVVRIARHRSGEPAASPERVERSVRHRSDEETTSVSGPAPKSSARCTHEIRATKPPNAVFKAHALVGKARRFKLEA